MNQSEKWTSQRLALLRIHTQEWNDLATQQARVRSELVSKHQMQKDELSPKASIIEWAHLIMTQGQNTINLVSTHQKQYGILKTSHEQQRTLLEKRIEQESLNDET